MANKFEAIRTNYINVFSEILSTQFDYDVLRTGSNEICLPIVNEEGEEGYLQIKFVLPKGARDGEAYDGYAEAENYKFKCEEKAKKKVEAERKKAEKIMKDAESRKAKAELRNAKKVNE
jgi:hypothetical protein